MNKPAAQLHERMPVVLAGEAEHAAWLNHVGVSGPELLDPTNV
ncbi:SOS response-associated peptidase [Conexibacter woesei]|nr:SOS response-associated peptidase [Conexibacter woesei]